MCLFPSVRSRSCVIGGGRGEEPKVKEEETFCEAQKPQDKGGGFLTP